MDNNENKKYSAEIIRKILYRSRGEVPVRLKLTSRHVIPDMSAFGMGMNTPSADLSLFEDELSQLCGGLRAYAFNFLAEQFAYVFGAGLVLAYMAAQ